MSRRSLVAFLVAVLVAAVGFWYLREASPPSEPVAGTSASTPQPSPPSPITSANSETPIQRPAEAPTPADAESVVAREAEVVLNALKARDMTELAKHVHPDKGLRLSPYIAIDPRRGVVLKAAELPTALANARRRRWGSEDGSGDPISLTFAEYYERFVWDRDYLTAAQRRINEFGSKSTTRPNVREVYPKAIVVEAHAPGTKPESEGMDWSSLLLVFEQHESRWYLSALVHDQWTI
jgi:hypothetical protein